MLPLIFVKSTVIIPQNIGKTTAIAIDT